jgi:xylan 1,4-beta-xylosidase
VRRLPRLPLCAWAASVALCSLARAQTQPPATEAPATEAPATETPIPGAVTISVDATAGGPALEHVWAYYGYDEANYTTTSEGEELLRTLVAVNTAPVRTRTHFLFNTGDGTPSLKWGSTNLYTEAPDGTPVYDYTLIDQIMDSTVEAGALPLVELGFMPRALSAQPEPYQPPNPYVLEGGSFYPPQDYGKWGELIRTWASHVKERYPNAEATWEWELWNEPDIGYWQGTFDEYARLYDTTEQALHAVFPNAPLGGPAVATPDRGFLTQFLEHCATGTNHVTGQVGTRLDLVSFHSKGGVFITDLGHVQMNLGNQLRLHRSGFTMVAASAFASRPVVISEADPDGCAACPVSTAPQNAYRNSPAYGAYEVAMMKHTLTLAKELGIDLRGVLTWAFTFPQTPYFAGYRALATHGIHLPVLNAFKLLGGLNGKQLAVTSSGALPLQDILEHSVQAQPDIDALAVIDGDKIQILVFNYHDDLVDAEPSRVTLEVALPPAFTSNASVTHTRVDEEHGNAYAVWVAQGSPEPPSASQRAELQAAMEPVVLSRQVVSAAGAALSLSFDLPRFGLSLLTLEPAPEATTQAPAVASRAGEAGCTCRLPAPPSTAPRPALLAGLMLTLLALAGRARRRPPPR